MVVLVVLNTLKPGTEEEAKKFLAPMEEASRKEPGCRMYVAHQSLENPSHFCFYEQYDDRPALEAHWASPHFEKYIRDGFAKFVETRQAELYEPVNP